MTPATSGSAHGGPADVFTVLTVCSGNVCRSPFGAAALQRALEGHPAVRCESAGTEGLEGAGADRLTAEVALTLGVDLAGHRARRLDAVTVADSDLILGMSRPHRALPVILHPRANRWSFTLVEFAGLAAATSQAEIEALTARGFDGSRELLRAVVRLIASKRGSMPLRDSERETIVDPYGCAVSVHERMADAILDDIDRVARPLLIALKAENRPPST